MCCVQRALHKIFHAVLYTAYSRATLKTRQNRPWSLLLHPGVPSLSAMEVQINTRCTWTQITHSSRTPFLLNLFLSCYALCLCNALVVLARVYWIMLTHGWCKTQPFVLYFVLRHFPAHWVCFVLFHLAVNVCFAACIGCHVEHITYIHTHTHASPSVGHTHII